MSVHNRLLIAGSLLAAAPGSPAWASPTTYTGEDIMATTTSPHPNSAAAAASFAAAVGTIGGTQTLVSFEGSPLGSFSSLTIAPGVTLSGTDYNGNNQTIRNTTNSPPYPTLDGYNTTPGGASFVEMQAGLLTFSFSTPVYAFGAYFSGVQYFFNDKITFSDGTSQTISIPTLGTDGGTGALDFVGFTDVGKAITSITIDAGVSGDPGADYIGVDDVRFATAPAPVVGAAPEPSIWAMMIIGFGLVGTVMRRPRKLATRFSYSA